MGGTMKQVIKQELTQWPIGVIWADYDTPTSPGIELQKPVGIYNNTSRAPALPLVLLAGRHYGWL